MSYVVVDTDVVSFGFRQDTRFAFYAPKLQGQQAVISFMTYAELQYWAVSRKWSAERQARLGNLLKEHYVLYPVSKRLCSIWAELTLEARSKGRVLHSADAWIAATAKRLGAPLITHNAKDYTVLAGLELISSTAS